METDATRRELLDAARAFAIRANADNKERLMAAIAAFENAIAEYNRNRVEGKNR